MTVLDNVTLGPRKALKLKPAEAEERGAGAAPALRAGGEGARVPGPALRRPAAARRDRAGAGDGARPPAARRGDLRARPGARRRGAQRRPRAGRRRHDDAHRHPRDGVRARHREPGLLPGRRADPGAGAARADLLRAPRGADPPVPQPDHRGGPARSGSCRSAVSASGRAAPAGRCCTAALLHASVRLPARRLPAGARPPVAPRRCSTAAVQRGRGRARPAGARRAATARPSPASSAAADALACQSR